MKPSELPLFKLFDRLRRQYELPLGIDEYLEVLRVLQAGFRLSSRQELEQLCCTLWATSEDEANLVHQLFEQMWQELTPRTVDTVPPSPKSTTSEPAKDLPPKESPQKSPPSDSSLSRTPSLPMEEPVQAVKVLRRHPRRLDFKRPRYSLLTDYFPVTPRQMKQSWRQLRRPVREGPREELDLAATAEKMGREAIFLEPVLVPRRSNRTDLVMLVDQHGSMVPFHDLSRQLIETAERGGRLKQTRIYYFHDYPDQHLYGHPALLEAQPIEEVLEAIGKSAVVLIISDAGAARGKLDLERVKRTQGFLERLKQSVRYSAWLNPMPNDCWLATTAGEIARFVPMFEMSRQGLNAAISVLRGRYVALEKLYPWMIGANLVKQP